MKMDYRVKDRIGTFLELGSVASAYCTGCFDSDGVLSSVSAMLTVLLFGYGYSLRENALNNARCHGYCYGYDNGWNTAKISAVKRNEIKNNADSTKIKTLDGELDDSLDDFDPPFTI